MSDYPLLTAAEEAEGRAIVYQQLARDAYLTVERHRNMFGTGLPHGEFTDTLIADYQRLLSHYSDMARYNLYLFLAVQ